MTTIAQHMKWLRARAKKEDWSLGCLTGQDFRALAVFITGLELWTIADRLGKDAAEDIMNQALWAMQPSVQWVAKKVIPAVLDWGDEEKIWALVETNESKERKAREAHTQ